LTAMGSIMKVVFIRYILQLYGSTYVGIVLLASIRGEFIGCNVTDIEGGVCKMHGKGTCSTFYRHCTLGFILG
jgi:hypothetical protein